MINREVREERDEDTKPLTEGRVGVKLEAIPTTIKAANAYIQEHHRHHGKVPGGLFAVGCGSEGMLCGVAIVGRPVARMLDDGWTCEVTRLCTDGTFNACSFLYSRAWLAARAIGYRRIITYILSSEPGTSLKAAGWRCFGEAGGGSWNRATRPRTDRHPLQIKIRWQNDTA